MKQITLTLGLMLTVCFAYSQIRMDSNGRVRLGSAPDSYATLNVSPQYSTPSSTNLIIGNWWSNYGLISIGVHHNYSWIQSWHVKPLHINQQGNHTIFGSASLESVGIGYGMGTPSAKLHVLGSIYATGTITSSDKRLKKNIRKFDVQKIKYKEISPVSFNFNISNRGFTMEGIDTTKVSKIDKEFYKRKHYGFVAQDVQKILPELVYEDNEGNLAVDYQSFIPILFELVKEQEETIEELVQEIEDVKENCCSDSNLKSSEINTGINENELKAQNSLEQNIPNPFTASTQIRFHLTEEVRSAGIYIYNMNGTQLKSIELHQTGDGSVTITGGEFSAGMYMYTLIADGQVVDTKKMVLTDQN